MPRYLAVPSLRVEYVSRLDRCHTWTRARGLEAVKRVRNAQGVPARSGGSRFALAACVHARHHGIYPHGGASVSLMVAPKVDGAPGVADRLRSIDGHLRRQGRRAEPSRAIVGNREDVAPADRESTAGLEDDPLATRLLPSPGERRLSLNSTVTFVRSRVTTCHLMAPRGPEPRGCGDHLSGRGASNTKVYRCRTSCYQWVRDREFSEQGTPRALREGTGEGDSSGSRGPHSAQARCDRERRDHG